MRQLAQSPSAALNIVSELTACFLSFSWQTQNRGTAVPEKRLEVQT